MATILVVDEERLICDLLRLVLSKHGHEVVIASNSQAALDLFTKRRPRLTIIDVCMPESGGIELLKQIHGKEPLAAVMILTGTATETLKSQARDWGVTDIFSKGLSLNELMGAVDRAIKKAAGAAPPSLPSPSGGGEPVPSGTPEPPSILVVDDDPAIRSLLTSFLTQRGYRVRTAPDGLAALAAVQQAAPQLIVLDIYLPYMTGVTVLRELRTRQFTGNVIVLSGSTEETLLDAMLKMGVVELIPKPFDLERLALAIQVGLILGRH